MLAKFDVASTGFGSSSRGKIAIFSMLIGNTLEWFDFAVYGYVFPHIASQFFPKSNPITALLATYSVFAVGFFARPIGAIFFGYIGDKKGRCLALQISLYTMSISTFFIGVLPTYKHIGVWSAIFLVACRILQGLSIGGEFTGSFVYLIEQSKHNKRGFYSCWADMGCSLGVLLGSLTIALIHYTVTAEEFLTWGWRLPFLSGFLIAGVGIVLRLYLPEISANDHRKNPTCSSAPLVILKKEHLSTTIWTTLLLAVNAVGYYTLLVYVPNKIALEDKINGSLYYLLNAGILITLSIATFLSGYLVDRINKSKILYFGYWGCLLLAIPTFWTLTYADFWLQALAMSCFTICLGCCFGPRSTFLSDSFPSHVRYTGTAISYNISNALFGGTIPFLATYLVEIAELPMAPAFLIVGACCLSLSALYKLNSIGDTISPLLVSSKS